MSNTSVSFFGSILLRKLTLNFAYTMCSEVNSAKSYDLIDQEILKSEKYKRNPFGSDCQMIFQIEDNLMFTWILGYH